MTEPAAGASASTQDVRVPAGVLIITSASTLIVNALTSSVGVLLPAMSRDTGASIQFLQWAIIGYSLASAAVIITAGSLGDMIGRRKVFMAGLALYTVASVLIAIGANGTTVVIGRCVQGFGAAAIMSAGLGIISAAGTGAQRLRGVTIWSVAAAIGGALGPLIGGLFDQTTGWQGMFWTIAILAGVTVLFTPRLVAESKSSSAAKSIDYTGTVLLAISLSTLVLAMSQGGVWGWFSGATLGCTAIGLVVGWLFLRFEGRVKEPLLDLSLLKNKTLMIASVALFISAGVINAAAYLLSVYLQSPFTLELTALQAGAVTLPATVAMVIASALLGGMTKKHGLRWVVTAGFGIMAVSCFALGFTSASWGVPAFLAVLFVMGFGVGMTNGPAASVSTSAVSADQIGSASGISNMARYLAAAIGISLTTSVYTSAAQRDLNSHLDDLGITGDAADTIGDQILASGSGAVNAVTQAAGSAADEVLRAMETSLPIGVSRVGFFWFAISVGGALMCGLAGNRMALRRRDGLEHAAAVAGTVHTVQDMGAADVGTVVDITDSKAAEGVESQRPSRSK